MVPSKVKAKAAQPLAGRGNSHSGITRHSKRLPARENALHHGLLTVGFLLIVAIYVQVAILFGVYTPELFPTEVRLRANGICNTIGRAATIVFPGRLNRIMNALVPASLARKMEADMIGKGLASKAASLAGSTGS